MAGVDASVFRAARLSRTAAETKGVEISSLFRDLRPPKRPLKKASQKRSYLSINSAERVSCSKPRSALLERVLKSIVNVFYTSTAFDDNGKVMLT
jgi:hypothetical protein